MENIKILIIDDNESLCSMVREYFSSRAGINVVLEAHDGLEGIEVIQNKQSEYDVVILDLIMPKKDGLYVLEEMKKRGIEKNIIVATSYNAMEVIRKVSEYGVNYYILKPFDFEDLEHKILELSKRTYQNNSIDLKYNNLQVSITKILHELGIPSHIKGYQYIREGIGILYERPETIGGITKEL